MPKVTLSRAQLSSISYIFGESEYLRNATGAIPVSYEANALRILARHTPEPQAKLIADTLIGCVRHGLKLRETTEAIRGVLAL